MWNKSQALQNVAAICTVIGLGFMVWSRYNPPVVPPANSPIPQLQNRLMGGSPSPAPGTAPSKPENQLNETANKAVSRDEPRRWLVNNSMLVATLALVISIGLQVGAAAVRRREKSAWTITVFKHDTAAVTGQLLVRQAETLFQQAGWRVAHGRTDLPEHAIGVWVRGATRMQRTTVAWALRTLGVEANIDERSYKLLEVIIGQHQISDRAKEELDRRSNEVLAEQQKDRIEGLERVVQEKNGEIERVRGLLGGAEQAWLTCKRQFALWRLRVFAQRLKTNIELRRAEGHEVADISFTVRFAVYDDYPLAEKIAKIITEETRWKHELDGSNKPLLKPHPEYKVIFVSGAFETFSEIQDMFQAGRLIDEPVAFRNDNTFESPSHFVVEVLPTMKT
jgi:hypothetical protein